MTTLIDWARSYMGKPNNHWFTYDEADFSVGQQWVSINYSEGFVSLVSSFAVLREDNAMKDNYWETL